MTAGILKKSENLSQLINNTSPKTQAKLTSKLLHSIAEQSGVGTRGDTINIQSGARLLPVTVGNPKQKAKEPFFSSEQLMRLQASQECSDRKLLKV